MDIQIIEQNENNVTLKAGNKTFFIMKTDLYINVLCKNAAHSAYRGLGRFFDTKNQAIEGYKSTAAKAAINTAFELLK